MPDVPRPAVTYREANRRYLRAFVPVMIVYVALCFAGVLLLDRLSAPPLSAPPLWLRTLVALASAAPIGLVFVLLWRYLAETDEYTRVRKTTELAAAGMLTACFATAWGFLELYDVVPSLWTFLLGPAFFASWLLLSLWRLVSERHRV